MEFKVLGFHLNLLVVAACVLLGMFLSCHVLWSCVHTTTAKKKVKEGLEVMGSALGYNMSSGVKGSWGPGHHTNSIAQQLNTHQGPRVPLAHLDNYSFLPIMTLAQPAVCLLFPE